jgi:hypothetical protein
MVRIQSTLEEKRGTRVLALFFGLMIFSFLESPIRLQDLEVLCVLPLIFVCGSIFFVQCFTMTGAIIFGRRKMRIIGSWRSYSLFYREIHRARVFPVSMGPWVWLDTSFGPKPMLGGGSQVTAEVILGQLVRAAPGLPLTEKATALLELAPQRRRYRKMKALLIQEARKNGVGDPRVQRGIRLMRRYRSLRWSTGG